MNGWVDDEGRAFIDVQLRARAGAPTETVTVWIDTGFTGDLVLPRSIVERLNLPQSGTTDATLADGSEVALHTFECYMEWFGDWLRLQVVANDGKNALLGVGLLWDHDLHVHYRTGSVIID
jgi:clan AA aspartic protease